LKNANPSRQEQARLEVENAEDDLVQKTEVAITLMKTVLENVCVGHSVYLWPLTCDIAWTVEKPQWARESSGNCSGHLEFSNTYRYSQLNYFSTAAEALNTVQGEIEELSVAAEGEYR